MQELLLPAIVLDNLDPDNLARVRVRFHSDGKDHELWARLATFMAGKDRGSWFIPDVDDEVLLAFDNGRPSHAYVIGSLWSATNPPPETIQTGNNRKVLRTRNGLKVVFNDHDEHESISIDTPGGQTILLDDGTNEIRITDGNGNTLKMRPDGFEIIAAARIKITTSELDISASMVNVNAGMSKFSGVVQCDTLISNSVVSASYTPGAGNVW